MPFGFLYELKYYSLNFLYGVLKGGLCLIYIEDEIGFHLKFLWYLYYLHLLCNLYLHFKGFMYFPMFECVQAACVIDMPFVLCKLCRRAVSAHCALNKRDKIVVMLRI